MYPIVRDEHRNNGPVMCQREVPAREGDTQTLEYLTFPALTACKGVTHLFTTRLGGVSTGCLSTMNLSFSRGDFPENVQENFRRIARVLGCTPDKIVCSDQTHTVNVRRVTKEDCGKGVTCPRDYQDVDGLVTDEPGIALATFYADCVPLYFVDCRNRAIGLAHSGWKGTAAGMGEIMVQRMRTEFGSNPQDLTAAIGPSICGDCYEVGDDVACYFQKLTKEEAAICEEIRDTGCYRQGEPLVVRPGVREGKYQLDLWLANLIILRRAGIPFNRIQVTDICTCHNSGYLFSHRASMGKIGNLGAFLMLNNS